MKIRSLSKLDDQFTRYDLSIKGTHNFVAEGVVVHNSSSHLSWKDNQLHLFAGGCKQEAFESLFDIPTLTAKFLELFPLQPVVIYGEVYGGKLQGMKATYGDKLKFIAFEVLIDEHCFLSVPQAHKIVTDLNLEFVHYVKVSTDLSVLDKERDAPSEQAIRNGMGNDKKREGIVLRPLIEVCKNSGERIIAKHKREDFSETKTPRPVDPEFAKVIEGAEAIADEWITPNRMKSVLGRFPEVKVEMTGDIIKAMMEDVLREGKDEVENTKENRKAIEKKTVQLLKEILKES